MLNFFLTLEFMYQLPNGYLHNLSWNDTLMSLIVAVVIKSLKLGGTILLNSQFSTLLQEQLTKSVFIFHRGFFNPYQALMGQPLAQFQAPAPQAVNMNHPLLSQMQVRQVET